MSAGRHPLKNRVTPAGDIIATPARGLLMGNRGGRLHRDDRTLGRRRWASKAWIACRLAFRDRHRTVMGRGYTELFFLDEATALAAGHRPCYECRRADATRFAACWAAAHSLATPPRAADMDAVLHRERRAAGAASAAAPIETLADGMMIEDEDGAWLVNGATLARWTPAGYAATRPRPRSGTARLITPPSVAAVLAAGYRPLVHPSAPPPGRKTP